jgi:hypothetical protein
VQLLVALCHQLYNISHEKTKKNNMPMEPKYLIAINTLIIVQDPVFKSQLHQIYVNASDLNWYSEKNLHKVSCCYY